MRKSAFLVAVLGAALLAVGCHRSGEGQNGAVPGGDGADNADASADEVMNDAINNADGNDGGDTDAVVNGATSSHHQPRNKGSSGGHSS